jgi:hypothetical protein
MGKKKIVPKRVAGVKLPKKLRKASNRLADMLSHPLVADVAAAALLSLAAAIKDSKKVREAAAAARDRAGDAADTVADASASVASKAVAAARDAGARVGIGANGNGGSAAKA